LPANWTELAADVAKGASKDLRERMNKAVARATGWAATSVAEEGLPPGADVDRASMAKLLDTWTVSRYELQPDRIVFYIWSWRAEGTHFGFRFTPRSAIHAKAAPSNIIERSAAKATYQASLHPWA
jgi:hypothetical protein